MSKALADDFSGGGFAEVRAVQRDGTGGYTQKPGNRVEGCGFARAVCTDEGYKLSVPTSKEMSFSAWTAP